MALALSLSLCLSLSHPERAHQRSRSTHEAQPTTTTTTTPLPPTSRPGRSLLITAENGVFLCKIPAVNASGLPLNPSSSNTCKPVALSSDAVQNPPAGLTKPFRSIQADNGDIIVVDKDNARIQRCPLVGPCFTVAPLGNMTLNEPRAVQLDEALVLTHALAVQTHQASYLDRTRQPKPQSKPVYLDPASAVYSSECSACCAGREVRDCRLQRCEALHRAASIWALLPPSPIRKTFHTRRVCWMGRMTCAWRVRTTS